jgi:RNA polymerase sigma factor (sigma-70 family)
VAMVTPDALFDHWPLLVHTVRQMLPAASYMVWEDVAADALERGVRNLHRFEDRGDGAATWLVVIAKRLVIDHARRQKLRQAVPLTDVHHVTVDAGWQHHIDGIDVQAAIAALPADLTTYVLHRRDGLTQEQAGQQMGWSKTMANTRNRTVRRALAAHLEASA